MNRLAAATSAAPRSRTSFEKRVPDVPGEAPHDERLSGHGIRGRILHEVLVDPEPIDESANSR